MTHGDGFVAFLRQHTSECAENINAINAIVHPDYLGDASWGADIALLQLARAPQRCSSSAKVRLDDGTHVLNLPELAYEIDPDQSAIKVRPSTKRVLVNLHKLNASSHWRKLTAV